MANIVVILGSYHPNYSAVGVCVKNVIDKLKKENAVTVICEKQNSNQEVYEEFEGYRILRINTFLNHLKYYLQEKKDRSPRVLSFVFTISINLVRSIRFAEAIVSKVNVKRDLVKCYVKGLEKLEDTQTNDVIIPCSFPFESVVAANKYVKSRNKDILVFPYLFDNFIEGTSLHRTRRNKERKRKAHIAIMRNSIVNSDRVIAIHTLQKHLLENFSNLQKKICYLEHPLLVRNSYDHVSEIHDSSCINMTYTGSFIKDYVTPEYLLNVCELLHPQIEFKIHFYITGNWGKNIEKHSSLPTSVIKNHGQVPFREALEAIIQSQILINVSEISGVQMSSKIFTYMSAGKPIINFYQNKDDINVKILKKYPLALSIEQNYSLINENVSLIYDFIKKHKNKNLSFDEVEKIYLDASPKYTADIIEALITNVDFQRNICLPSAENT